MVQEAKEANNPTVSGLGNLKLNSEHRSLYMSVFLNPR